MSEVELQQIYLQKIVETFERITVCTLSLNEYKNTNVIYAFETSVLQLRKALENIAFASIAPNKLVYEEIRRQKDKDYSRDYKADDIFNILDKVNKDFYPIPLFPAVRQKSGEWHYDRKEDGYLTKKQFISLYNRLGKYLHADNPWGNDKGVINLAKDIPRALAQIQELLTLHFTVIRTPEFQGIWVIEAGQNTTLPRVINSIANGEFIVQ